MQYERRSRKTKAGLIVAFAAMGLFTASAMADAQSASTTGFHSTRSCESCHVPHGTTGDNSQVPLWNPEHSTTTLTGSYTASEATQATLGNPDGASKLCLSCHDGSYAHVNSLHKFGAGNTLGALSNSHPVSFVYDAALVAAEAAASNGVAELKDPSTLAQDVLDGQNKMQCTSCHDIHSTTFSGKSSTTTTTTMVQDKDAQGNPVDTNGDGNLTNDLNTQQTTTTNNEDGHYLRWPYYTGGSGTNRKGDFCRTCHLK
jgi:hypothetical protein